MHTHSNAAITNADNVILIRRIDAVLPQTQCRQCGYDGCKPYAVAIAEGQAKINQCPPGGELGVRMLANLLNVPYLPLNTSHGMTKPKAIAMIDELKCIGCTLCIQACPVDAILGASKQMHTVISQECTGCELCLAPCPVDCIIMQPLTSSANNPLADKTKIKAAADLARNRHENRLARLARNKQEHAKSYIKKNQHFHAAEKSMPTELTVASPNADAIKKTAIAAAMARVKALKAASPNQPK